MEVGMKPKPKARATPGRARRNATKDEDDPRVELADQVFGQIERLLDRLLAPPLGKKEELIVLRRLVERLEGKLEAMELERMGVEVPRRRLAEARRPRVA
jgi:hypothetical protein